MNFDKEQIDIICDIAKQAGDIELKYYQKFTEADYNLKDDKSEVTKADLEANDFIITQLEKNFSNIEIVSEENKLEDNLKSAKKDNFFIIDPLDGTSGFIKKSNEFSVNIAYVEDNIVRFGCIYMPALDLMYFNDESKSYKISNYSSSTRSSSKISVSSNKKNKLKVICTKRDPEKSEIMFELEKKGLEIKEISNISSSYKFCLIAQGSHDYYPRRANINAWDIAAGHAIIKSAGGNIFDNSTNKEILYNFDKDFKVEFFNAF